MDKVEKTTTQTIYRLSYEEFMVKLDLTEEPFVVHFNFVTRTVDIYVSVKR